MRDLLLFDKTVFAWINITGSNPIFDAVMPWITHLGDAAAVGLWIALAGWLMGRQISRAMAADRHAGQYRAIMKTVVIACLYMALIFGVNAGVYNSLKHLFNRPRPFVQQTAILRVSPETASRLGDNRSFPSGHSASIFMVAVFLAERLRRKRRYLYSAAALVAFSRIYLGVHYLGDVLAGAFLGFSIACLMLFSSPLKKRIAGEHLLLHPQ
jgi:undecaprenyl-diphosphatase